MGHGVAPVDSSPGDGSPRHSASGSDEYKSQSGHTIPDVHDMTLLEEARAMIAKQKAQ